jgi:hypothetical protein
LAGDQRRIRVDCQVGNFVPGEHLAHELPHAPEAGDDHMSGLLRWGRLRRCLLDRAAALKLLAPPAPEAREGGNGDHGHRGDEQHLLSNTARDESGRHRATHDDECELAAGAEEEGGLGCDRGAQAEGPSEPEDDDSLRQNESQGGHENRPWCLDEARDVETHSDRNEEHAEQEAFEGIDRGLDRAAILGLREQQPGDKGAERHRKPTGGCDKAGSQHHQE